MTKKVKADLNRTHFGFLEQVLTSFSFLSTEYGFRCKKKETTYVRYESSQVFVNVYHGRISYEIGFEIGLLPNFLAPEEKFTLGDVIQLKDALNKTGYNFFQASTSDRVKLLVSRLADLVREYAVEGLNGEEGFFKKLRTLQKMNSDQLLLEMRLAHIRSEVDKYWKDKNYVKVVGLYKSIENDLSELEQKKLKYAQKIIDEGYVS